MKYLLLALPAVLTLSPVLSVGELKLVNRKACRTDGWLTEGDSLVTVTAEGTIRIPAAPRDGTEPEQILIEIYRRKLLEPRAEREE